MNPTGGFTDTLSPDAVRTAIDAVLWEEYSREQQPAYLSVNDAFFFKQGQTVGLSFIYTEDQNVGVFQETGEEEEILNTDSRLANKTTRNSVKWTKQVPISDEAFRADQVGKRNNIGKNVGDRARMSQDFRGIVRSYGDAFAGSIFTTPDGGTPASNSHTTVQGITVDNLETGSLTPANLWTAATSLANQRGQDGDAGSHIFEGLLVPFTLYKTAKEVTNSQLIANSAENNLNIFDSDYGNLMLRASIFLGSTYNSAANANTSYHLIGRNHFWERRVFYGLDTKMIPPENTANDTWLYRAKYHEVCFPGSWTAYVGSNGTT